MYQDPEVAQIIRRLDERKREAVQQERYDFAKSLKQAIADLQKVGFQGRAPPTAPQRLWRQAVSGSLGAAPGAHPQLGERPGPVRARGP